MAVLNKFLESVAGSGTEGRTAATAQELLREGYWGPLSWAAAAAWQGAALSVYTSGKRYNM